MSPDRSRRQFLQAGLALPAVSLVSSNLQESAPKTEPKIVYRTLGKTGLKVSGVGYGIGFKPVPEVAAHQQADPLPDGRGSDRSSFHAFGSAEGA